MSSFHFLHYSRNYICSQLFLDLRNVEFNEMERYIGLCIENNNYIFCLEK